MTINPSSVDVLFGVTDAAADVTVSTDDLDGLTVSDVRVNPPVKLDWLGRENAKLDDATDGAELGVLPMAVGVGDMIPCVIEFVEVIGNTSWLDDAATALDTGVDSFPETVAMEDKTPALDTMADIDGLVVFWETMTLDPSPTAVVTEDSTPTPTELKLDADEVCEGTVAVGNKPGVFTEETVSWRLGNPEGETADDSETALVWLMSSVELENDENWRVKFTTELLLCEADRSVESIVCVADIAVFMVRTVVGITVAFSVWALEFKVIKTEVSCTVVDFNATELLALNIWLLATDFEVVLAKIVTDIPWVEKLSVAVFEALGNLLLVKELVANVLFVAMAIELDETKREFPSWGVDDSTTDGLRISVEEPLTVNVWDSWLWLEIDFPVVDDESVNNNVLVELTRFDWFAAEETTEVRYDVDADVVPCCNEGDISDLCSCWDEEANVLASVTIKALELFRLKDEEDTDEMFIE